MKNRDFFRKRWRIEYPLFLKMLRALPEEKIDYRPHEKSNTAARIAWILAQEIDGMAAILGAGEAQWEPRPHPKSFAEIIESYERSAAEVNRQLEQADDARWESPARFMAGTHVIFAAPVGEQCWWLLFDGIHHRGQLSAYVRPMGGKVPSTYGPSADEK
jgi:uncharacterized damage-inducible protein DinB